MKWQLACLSRWLCEPASTLIWAGSANFRAAVRIGRFSRSRDESWFHREPTRLKTVPGLPVLAQERPGARHPYNPDQQRGDITLL